MKKILFLFLLIPVMAQAQEHDAIPQEWAQDIIVNSGWVRTSLSTLQLRIPDCEPWETFTEWKAENMGKSKCAHDWVVAEWREVNGINFMQTSEMPPPCGKTRTDNEARICRHCLRHETRIRMHGMKEVEAKSEFQTLLKKIKQ